MDRWSGGTRPCEHSRKSEQAGRGISSSGRSDSEHAYHRRKEGTLVVSRLPKSSLTALATDDGDTQRTSIPIPSLPPSESHLAPLIRRPTPSARSRSLGRQSRSHSGIAQVDRIRHDSQRDHFPATSSHPYALHRILLVLRHRVTPTTPNPLPWYAPVQDASDVVSNLGSGSSQRGGSGVCEAWSGIPSMYEASRYVIGSRKSCRARKVSRLTSDFRFERLMRATSSVDVCYSMGKKSS